MKPEDQLTDALHDRVERTDYPSTPLSAVAGRAGAIRARRRRTTALAAAAAVGVIVVPGALWLGRSPDASPPQTGPSSSNTATPTQAVGLQDLARGPKPGIDYIRGSDYVAVGGSTTHLPLEKILEATPYRGGFLVDHTGPDLGPRLTWLDNTLRARSTSCGTGLTLSGDRTLLAFMTDDCTSDVATVHLAIPSGMSNSDQTASVRGLPVLVIGIARGAVVYSRLPGHGVFVTRSGGSDHRVPGLSDGAAVDPTGTYVAGQSADDETIGELVDLTTGAVLWQARGRLAHFSPDGRYLLAASASDHSSFTVLDSATGHAMGMVTVPRGLTVEQIAWDNDDSILALLRDHGTSDGPHLEAIARFDVQGGLPTLATTPVRVAGLQTGYRFAATS